MKKLALFLSVACATQASATLPFTPDSLKKNLSILEARTEENYTAITAVATDAKDTYKHLKEMGSDPKVANAPQVIGGELRQLELSKKQILSLQENVNSVQADATALLEQAEKLRSDRATKADALLIQDQAEQLLSDAKRQETFIATHSDSMDQWLSEAREIQSTLPAAPVAVAEAPAEDGIEKSPALAETPAEVVSEESSALAETPAEDATPATSIVARGNQPESLAPLKREETVAANETAVVAELAPTPAVEEELAEPVALAEQEEKKPVVAEEAQGPIALMAEDTTDKTRAPLPNKAETLAPIVAEVEVQKDDLTQLLSEDDLADIQREISEVDVHTIAAVEDDTSESVQPAFYMEPEPFVGEFGHHPKRKKSDEVIPVTPKDQKEDPKKTSSEEPHNLLQNEPPSLVSEEIAPEVAMETTISAEESDAVIPASEVAPETTTVVETSATEGAPLATIKFGPNAPTYKWYTVQAINRGLYQNPNAQFDITASEAGLGNAEQVKTTLVGMGINADQLHVTKGALEDGSTVHIYAR